MPSVVDEILSSRRDGAAAEEAGRERKEKPVLYTTVVDAEPQYAGMAGQCLYESCDCRFFTGESGRCGACGHPNLYHLVKPNREDVQLRQAEDDRLRRLFVKRQMREQREAEERRSREAAAHPVQTAANTLPCSVTACDCTRFTAPPQQHTVAASEPADTAAILAASPASPSSAPDAFAASLSSPRPAAAVASPSSSSSSTAAFTLAIDSARHLSVSGTLTGRAVSASPSNAWGGGGGWGGTSGSAALSSAERASLLPRLCKKCRHAEMYHVRPAEDDDKKKAKGKTGSASPKKK